MNGVQGRKNNEWNAEYRCVVPNLKYEIEKPHFRIYSNELKNALPFLQYQEYNHYYD